MNSIVNQLQKYLSKGWHIFPCHYPIFQESKVKCSCGQEHKQEKDIGKHPLTSRGYLDATNNLKQIEGWWAYKNWNVGIATGKVSGIWVLDADGEKGIKTLQDLEARHGAMPLTLKAISGRPDGGTHYYYAYNDCCLTIGQGILEGIDFRGTGGYVIAPPSIHKSGKSYRWENADTPIANAPQWLLDALNALADAPALLPDAFASHIPPYSYTHSTHLLGTNANICERPLMPLKVAEVEIIDVSNGKLAEEDDDTPLSDAEFREALRTGKMPTKNTK